MLRQTFFSRRLGVGLALAFALAAPSAAGAQPMELDTPADSPLWWTLTDEVSPVELRAAFRDTEAHMRRYEEALEAGVVSNPLSDKALSDLSFYCNLRLTPELTPMWLAFSAFGGGHIANRGIAHAEDTLAEYGFGPAAIETILLYASRQERETLAIVEEVGAKSMRFTEIQRDAIHTRGGDRRAKALVRRAAEQGDLDVFLPSTEVPLSELAELRAAWLRHPVTETAEHLLPELRQRLTDEDWQRFRHFLLEHVVASMGDQLVDFDEGKGAQG